MKNLFIILTISAVLFSSCTRNNNSGRNNDLLYNNSHDEQETIRTVRTVRNVRTERNEYINENYLTLLEIKEYIYKQLNLNSEGSFGRYSIMFKSVEEILSTINVTDDHKLTKSIVGPVQDGYFEQYTFEWTSHVMIFNKYGDSENFVYEGITISLNQNNYLDLFPYRSIEMYKNDENFGVIDNRVFVGSFSLAYGFDWEEDWGPSERVILTFAGNGSRLNSINFYFPIS
ncbi:MAG: hypothetical protein FWD28_01110 [Treponema sp.]|nr:hypothetical protein [Treponema sp.]